MPWPMGHPASSGASRRRTGTPRPFDDERMLVNFSVWESAEALHTFVYRTQHAEVMRYRREGVERVGQPFTVLWWVRAGPPPPVHEAIQRPGPLRRPRPNSPTGKHTAQIPAP